MRFGQKVKLEVFDKSKTNLVFSTETLRVDFDIRNKFGLNTAKFTIYNLNEETSANILNGDRYVRLSVALHDQDYVVLVSDMFVSNSYKETILPNKLTYLFCYDIVTKESFEEPVSTILNGDLTLKRLILSAARAANYTGDIRFDLFPEEVLKYKPPRKYGIAAETDFKTVMKDLAKSYNFQYSVRGKDISVVYIPNSNSLGHSLLSDSRLPVVVLDSNNLRSNPKIGPANLEIVSNLDASIVPSTILDISNLITASANMPQDQLELAKDLLRLAVTGFKKYVCLESRHTGSNYTKVWNTTATAVSPRKGTKMNTARWGIV